MLAAKKADLIATGSGFFVSSDGYFVTNYHVVKGASVIRIKRKDDVFDAKIARVDAVNDIAVLKAAGNFPFLSLGHAEAVMLGADVFTIGFPNPNLQGFAPKLTRGDISGRSGLLDDPRMFQISIPLQPGNSGGALVDEHGNVVGVVSAKLSAAAALKVTGELPENVNYAVKSSFVLGFLESIPEVTAKLKEPNTSDMQFADVVEKAKEAAVLVLIY